MKLWMSAKLNKHNDIGNMAANKLNILNLRLYHVFEISENAPQKWYTVLPEVSTVCNNILAW